MPSPSLSFSNDNIFDIVIGLRLSLLDKRSKLHSDREISTHKKTNFHSKESYKGDLYLNKIVPPRRHWVRPGFDRRLELTSSKARTRFSLKTTYEKIKIAANFPDWYKEFTFFCDYIRYKVENIQIEKFSPPQIIAIPKKKKNHGVGRIDCRPLAKYDLEDRIIIGITARYFVSVLDIEFQPNSFAFRKIPDDNIAITHHNAFEKIIEYKKRRPTESMFVAECDIRKFYDCVNHEKLLECFDKIEQRLILKDITIDIKAKDILHVYLESYNFFSSVHSKNGSNWFYESGVKGGYFPWELSDLKNSFNYDFSSGNIVAVGVPQGGALSCVISNIIMDHVDRQVLEIDSNVEPDKDLLYIRYCDDMILIHTDLERCDEALIRYGNAINECKLLPHIPDERINTQPYKSQHWKGKTKPIYKWASNTKKEKSSVPWISFVGYQLNYDLKIRVRKDSIKKQESKLKEEYSRILKAIHHDGELLKRHHMRVNYKSILNTFKTRLISLSVGKANLESLRIKKYELCWANGFKLLSDNPIIKSQLRKLDKTRTLNYYKLHKAIPKIDNIKSQKRRGKKYKDIYYGSPFSYHDIIR